MIADADRTNPTLTAFFPRAERPPSAENDDVRLWLNKLADTQIENRTNVYLDLGGGDLTLRQWSRDLDLGPFLESYGITPVLLHVLGSDLDDVTYLRELEGVFAPKHTAIVLNEGMVPSGRSPLTAFGPLIDRPEFKAARDRGVVVVKMPRLGCMQDIDRQRMSFADADGGVVKAGGKPLPPTMRQEVRMWLRGMSTSLAGIQTWIT